MLGAAVTTKSEMNNRSVKIAKLKHRNRTKGKMIKI